MGPISAAETDNSSGNREGITGFVFHPIYLEHFTGARHPERQERLTAIVNRLQETGLIQDLVSIEPRQDVLKWIETVHDPEYVRHVREQCEKGDESLDTGDTPISPQSYDAACAAVGGVLAAVDAVMKGQVENAFCAVRPPGHHATKDRGMGFCIFNNVAVAARYIQKQYQLRKVLIVDWDVHHGNGTQDIFYPDPTVMYFSTHQYPFYPGTGTEDEKGKDLGYGHTFNFPVPAGTDEETLVKIYDEKLRPAAREFKPDFVLISAGFDAHRDDLLGGLGMTEEGFARLSWIVKAIAEECCKGRIVSVLEGGYNLDALAKSVEAHVRVLARKTSKND